MYIADFHIHSKYSRATSKNMQLDELARWAGYKGINLLGSSDFTHFLWYHELKEKLKETDREGIYHYGGIAFILTTEVSHIYEKYGKTKKVHNIIFISSIEHAGKLNRVLERYADLNSDGRPILPFEAKEIVNIVSDVDEKGFVVPAHIWTPHFSLFGSNSGFDTIEECFEETVKEIFALETGLSSDPAMNWMVSALDKFSLISNSDAHSPWKIGREANVFDSAFSFSELKNILKSKDRKRFLFTVEYFPEEGKYHFDGHRNCNVCLSPEESLEKNNLCPVCGRKITIGVLHRVRDLADRDYGTKHKDSIPFKKLIPLSQIIGFALNKPADSISVRNKLIEAVKSIGSEFSILFEIPLNELKGKIDGNIVDLLYKMREGEIQIKPGYDGEFGTIKISGESNQDADIQSLF